MPIQNFIESLENDKLFRLQIAGHKYFPPVEPLYRKPVMTERLQTALKNRGIELFYRHQVEAIERIRQGKNVVVMTPTASGKSLIYNIPVIEAVLENPQTKALYIFPLKGLEQDQVKNLNELFRDVAINTSPDSVRPHFSLREEGLATAIAEVYDGDTTAYRRKKIRESVPNVIFTNPDMLHLAITPFHKKWEQLFRNLRYVIIDEIHTYRGVFGSHVAHVLRRLRRICRHWGTDPQFIAASATIANPAALAETLTGAPFHVIDQSGAPQHAAIACIPLFALCDRGDIGGLSYPFYPFFRQPAIFIYDGYEGGIGLTRRAVEVIEEWLLTTLKLIEECPCEGGCPSCVQDPQCGSGNQPLEKEGAKLLLRRWLC